MYGLELIRAMFFRGVVRHHNRLRQGQKPGARGRTEGQCFKEAEPRSWSKRLK